MWKRPSERVDVLTRFLTRDGRETGRTQRSQDEEEEPYTMKTKTSTLKHEVPTPCGRAVNNNTDLSTAEFIRHVPPPAALQAPPLAWMFPHAPVVVICKFTCGPSH